MIYVFEDHEDDYLSKLNRQSVLYNNSHIVYTAGNGNLTGITEKLIKTTSDFIVIFLDTVPGNKYIRKINIDLQRLCKKYPERAITINIICSEFNFISALKNMTFLHKDITELKFLLSKEPHYCSKYYNANALLMKNYEKYCKFYLKNLLEDCIRTRDLCDTCDNSCPTSQELSLLFSEEFGLIPSFSREDAIKLHQQCVQRFNELNSKYINYLQNNASLDDIKNFKNIYPVQSQSMNIF